MENQKQVSASGFGIFRIIFFTVQFCEVFQLFSFKELVFDTVPFIQPNFTSLNYFFYAWLLCLFLLIIGYKTRLVAIINFAFNLVYFSVSQDFEYHMDYVYTLMNLMSIFMPIALSYSVDALKQRGEIPKISYLNHLAILFMAIALVYFDSMFHKVTSPMWMGGLGVWTPASHPHFTWLDIQWLLNQKYLMMFMGFLTLCLEATFPVLMWFRKTRPILALVGFGLHFGIFIAFPIPLFAFCYCGIYFLMLPEEFYEKLDPYFLSLREKLNLKVDEDWKPFNGLSEKTVAILIVTSLGLQLNSSLLSPGLSNVVPRELKKTAKSFQDGFVRPFIGITRHGVFMDWHFKTSRIVTVVKETKTGKVLPFHRESGRVFGYPFGRFWVNATFRFLNIQYPKYEEGLKRYSAFWAIKNKRDLRNVDFEVFIKDTEVATKWEKDFLTKQMNKPLIKIADIQWRNYQFKLVPVKKNSPQA